MRLEGRYILSSSPECFLTLLPDGSVESRPIKGTAPKSEPPEQLAASPKDRAENLMITDLMRHDFSQHCVPGTVKVPELFGVTSYQTLHHMHSTVTGQRLAGVSALQMLESCFPPGSMTGAPKKAVIQWCAAQEKQARGVYSGALGWVNGQGAGDFSVVIRTLLLHDTRFEFQVGGGIVADSAPVKEWEETLTKAKGIMKALGLGEVNEWLK